MASRQPAPHMSQPMGKAAQGRQVAEPIAASEEYMRHLTKLIPSNTELVKAGFVMNPLTKAELQAKVKCKKCNKKCTKPDRAPPRVISYAGEGPRNGGAENGLTPTPPASSGTTRRRSHGKSHTQAHGKGKQNETCGTSGNGNTKQQQEQQKMHCKFHPGRVNNKIWTCCTLHVSKPPCSGAPSHTPTPYAPGVLESRWLFKPTPSHPSPTPQNSQVRRAVAIDCEMGTAFDLESELIRISLIDYFSGQILIDSLVRPLVAMQHMNTKYSGVTRQDIQNAVRNGTCILGGLEEARKEVWKFVGPDTIVVGHSVRNDLSALRWIHGWCVDSLLVEEGVRREQREREEREDMARRKREFEEGVRTGEEIVDDIRREKEEKEREKKRVRRSEDGKSLKALAKKKLGRVIQDGGSKGHDSVEDAVAARDLVHHHVLGVMREEKEEREKEEKAEQARKEEQARNEAEENARAAVTADDGPETRGVAPASYCISHFPVSMGR